MALRDWNNDGQKNFTDDFIERNIYKNAINYFDKKDKEYISNSKKSELPIGLIFKILLKVNVVIWSLVLVMYLIDLLIEGLS